MMKLARRKRMGQTVTVAVFTGANAETGAQALAQASGGRAERDSIHGDWIVRPAGAPRFDI